jgi:hypothetical protein
MSETLELYAIDDNGKELLSSVLAPFWKTVFTAFLNKSNEIIIRANRLEARDVDIRYQKEGAFVTLTPSDGFHPFISSSRIRMISGMVIAPDISQHGNIRVRFEKMILSVDIQIEVENNDEILRLKPQWELK